MKNISKMDARKGRQKFFKFKKKKLQNSENKTKSNDHL